MIESWGPGGAETVCLELAAGLDRTRFMPASAVIREGWVFDALRARGLDPTIVRTGSLPIDLRFLAGLARLVRRRRIDVIQSHLLGANLYCSIVGRMLGVPVFSTFHGTGDVRSDDRFAAAKLRLIGAGSRRLIFVSDALRRILMSRVAIPPGRTAVVHNGIDTDLFAPRRSDVLRRELAAGPDAVIVGAVGNIRPEKGYDTLLRVAHACADDPRLVFVVIGKDPRGEQGALEALQRGLGSPGRVRFLGFREDIPELLNGLDVYLSTSRSEGFSLTTVQAMACAVPVVVTRSGGPEEIVTPGADGLLCAVDDVPALAACVRDLAADPRRRAELGAAGRRTAVTRFSVRRMVEAYTALYDSAAP